MAQLASAGHRVVIATMTPGDCGSRDHGPDEIAAIRRAEAAASARRIGAVYHCVEFRDLAVFSDDASRRRVTEVLRRLLRRPGAQLPHARTRPGAGSPRYSASLLHGPHRRRGPR